MAVLDYAGLQTGIYNILAGDATLGALITGVYDSVPEGTALPYVVIGDPSSADWDTKDTKGQRGLFYIHVWSEYAEWSEAYSIMDRIDTLLAGASISLSVLTALALRVTQVTCLRDVAPHGRELRHGILSVEFTITE